MKTILSTFILVGTVDSKDMRFASVEINTNPPMPESSMAILPVSAFPCEIKEGDKFFILRLTSDDQPVIICRDSNNGE